MKSEKVSQFVIQLIKLTRSGELVWKAFATAEQDLPGGEIILDKVYEATINYKLFNLYRYCYEDDYENSERIRLALVDKNGDTDYEFEYDNSMHDLYDIVREQASNVVNIVDDILGLKLEIIEAKYYTPKQSKDITEKVRNKVINNRLVLDATNDIDGDPDHGTTKQLRIKYQYAGETKEKEVSEGQTIILP